MRCGSETSPGSGIAGFARLGLGVSLAVVIAGAVALVAGSVAPAASQSQKPADFAPALGSPFHTGNGPRSVAVGHLNGDGNRDLAIAKVVSNEVTVLLSQGGRRLPGATLAPGYGSFAGMAPEQAAAFVEAPGSPYQVAASPTSVEIAHLDGDADADLAVANPESDTVSVLWGNGDGGFEKASAGPFPVGGDEPFRVSVGDLNGDETPELVTANLKSFDVSVLVRNGETFEPAAQSPFQIAGDRRQSDLGVRNVKIRNVNGDPHPDLLINNGRQDKSLSVLLGGPDITFPTRAPGSPFSTEVRSYDMAVGKLNNDPHPDVVMLDSGAFAVSVMLGDGNGGFGLHESRAYEGVNFPVSVATGDVNGDDNPDLAITSQTASGDEDAREQDFFEPSKVGLLLGDGTGKFNEAPHSPFDVGANPLDVRIAKLDGDRKPDLAVTNTFSDNVSVLLQGVAANADASCTPDGCEAQGGVGDARQSGKLNNPLFDPGFARDYRPDGQQAPTTPGAPSSQSDSRSLPDSSSPKDQDL